MPLAEVLVLAESKLGRRLGEEEIALVGRMVEAERSEEDILGVLGAEAPPPAEEETYLYEASGEGVVRIPDVVPDEGETDDEAE